MRRFARTAAKSVGPSWRGRAAAATVAIGSVIYHQKQQQPPQQQQQYQLQQQPIRFHSTVANCDGQSGATPTNQSEVPPTTTTTTPPLQEEDDAWEVEKEKCSFCKAFLKSPCKLPFKNWSICVDKAKEENQDFVQVCSEFTNALLECTSANSEYFAELDKSDDVAEGEEEGEGRGEVEPAEAEAKEGAKEEGKPEESANSRTVAPAAKDS